MDRYSRQIAFPGIGAEGQEKIQASTVAIVGCGALGSVVSELLARAGVGTIRLIDRDILELHNLQRQTLFTESDVKNGLPKAVAAADHLRKINSEIRVEDVVGDFAGPLAEEFLQGVDLVLDGADNFETRYLVNEICVRQNTPWVYAACVGSYAVSAGILPHETACLRCFLEEPPPPGESPTCDTAGILAPAVHAAVALEVATGMRILVHGEGAGKMVSVDLWGGPIGRVELGSPSPDCPVCVHGRYDYLEGRKGSHEAVLCGRDAVQIRPEQSGKLDLEKLEQRLQPLGSVERNAFLLRFHEENGRELVCFADGRCLVMGTQDPSEARSLYARYIGN